ncbi:uncharacterized protein LOC107362005 isoform X1 [Tetranychus urticae]|uniref:uncharacterized protein LOC107362005 isoform X1 n=1 Tax=Tetranychus urticae TaxID=32264 RepID=UPI00077BC3AC|nr:uncharacterized protein LOC107362005 isoform X1 [Tetranychus urticae]
MALSLHNDLSLSCPTMEYGIEEDEPEDDQEESQTESPSLPSLPLSLQEQLACPAITNTQRNQAMSMKEIDSKLNNLRRENFDLKLRLFYEKQNKGVRRSDGDSFIEKDYDKYEKALEEYKRALEAKDHQLNLMKNRLEENVKDKEFELNILRTERDAFASDLQVTTSICKSFMSHLYDVRDFWTRHLKEKGIQQNENFIDSVNYWLNSSEDLLNSASVLISDEFDGGNGPHQRRLYPEMFNMIENRNRGNPLIEINLADKERSEYLKHKNFLYNISSESEEEWSEPDRNVSKSRIGIETCTDLNTLNSAARVPLKSRMKRLSSSAGMSSLGLLSDFSEFIAERQRGRHKSNVNKVNEATQTLVCSDDLDKLIDYCRKDELKRFSNCHSQTDEDLKKHYQSSQSCQTVSRDGIDNGSQTDVAESKCEEKGTETEPMCLSSVSSQTVEISTEKGVQFAERTKSHSDKYSLNHENQQPQQSPYHHHHYHHHLDIKSRLSPTSTQNQANTKKDLNSSQQLTRSPSTSQQSLFSYKTILTPMTKPMFKNVDYSECEYLKEMDSKTSTSSLSRSNYKNTTNDNRSNMKSRYSSCDDINFDRSMKFNNHADYAQDETPSNKKFYMTSSYSTSKIYDIINNQVKGINKGKNLFSMEKLNLKGYTDKSCGKGTGDDSENCNLSSPDLGIGDSDQDMNSTLRAYISLGHYQLLRGNLNQLSSYLNCLDNLYRDCFLLQSINLSEYMAAMKPNLANLNQIFNSSRNICKNFTIEDENSISLQLEKVKAKKESMEKAITRQLRKTDKLLRKAKLNLKES